MLDNLFLLSQHFLENYQRPYTRYFFKHQFIDCRLAIIKGARGVGKSTALAQYLLSKYPIRSHKMLYIQTDHFLIKPYSLYEIAEKFCQQGGEIICFDEIHNMLIALKPLARIFYVSGFYLILCHLDKESKTYAYFPNRQLIRKQHS